MASQGNFLEALALSRPEGRRKGPSGVEFCSLVILWQRYFLVLGSMLGPSPRCSFYSFRFNVFDARLPENHLQQHIACRLPSPSPMAAASPSSSSSHPPPSTSSSPSAGGGGSMISRRRRSLLRGLVSAWLRSSLGYPVVSLLYCLLLSPLAVKRVLDTIRGRQEDWSEQPLTAEVRAALNDERWGRHRWIMANGIRFHLVENKGGGGGEPPGAATADKAMRTTKKPLVLFLHGFPEFWYSWRHQLSFLGSLGAYHCVALDLRGYGETDKPQGREAYTIETLVADVKAVIHALGYDKAVLVGHDWGGKIAWHVAHAHGASLLSGLVVLNFPHPVAAGPRIGMAQFFKSWYIFFFQAPWLPEVLLSSDRFRCIAAAFMSRRAGLRRRHLMTPTDLACMVHAFSRQGVATAACNYYRNMLRPWPLWLAQAMKRPIDAEAVPTLVLWGEDDASIGRELSEGLDKVVVGRGGGTGLYGGGVHYVKDCSHWIQMDAPQEVNHAIADFLAHTQQPQAHIQQQQQQQPQEEASAAAPTGSTSSSSML